ncbi:hypothetical protein [Cohnella nanjingensis]|uniref:Uncharacterized protein n=1 Tax=Cohnella nanjingensis TaxID=1387779 RepID=A0A7X0RRZ9_9BACL|nr:hypothetical protein [Cohnella nanjingensis]MBB6672599.1 hypothetical protein [Cohnella nanjingensis]
MDHIQLSDEIRTVSTRLQKAADAMFKLGAEKAEAERVYRMRLSQEILTLKSEGMSATLIPDIARGNVSDLLFQRDATEVKFKAATEACAALKASLSALQSILRIQESA